MDVNEALRIADSPRNYTSLEQHESRDTLAAEVRRLRGVERQVQELCKAARCGVPQYSTRALVCADAIERVLRGEA